ncbi:MAG: extracellular solute-binding protein, partial [Oscillospiraceae bacterium]|nr:extracellular solute-binding protein [Oscillospiraceae bacterium]
MLKIFKFIITSLALMMLILLLAGCQTPDLDDNGSKGNEDSKGDDGSIDFDMEGYVFLPDFFEISGDFREITHTYFTDDRIYFSTMGKRDETSNTYQERLFTANLDGSEIIELTAYNPFNFGNEKTDSYGLTYIQSMLVDIDGNIWVVEKGSLYEYDLPADFSGDDSEKAKYLIELDSYAKLKKLDATGVETFSIDLSAILSSDLFVESFEVDNEGNAYVLLHYQNDYRVYVFDNTGKELFHLDGVDNSTNLIRLQDGSVAGVWISGGSFGNRYYKKIDLSGRRFNEEVELPSGTRQVFAGNRGFDFLIDNNKELYGFVIETDETVILFNWEDVKLSPSDTNNVHLLSDGRILGTERFLDFEAYEFITTFIMLSRIPIEDVPEQTTLTMVVFDIDRVLERAVAYFNRTNPLYNIQIDDYSRFATHDNPYAGLYQLTTEITTGKVPDILDIAGLPITQYISSGLLVDLYELIDADPEFNRDSFLSGVLRASEVNSGLYYVFQSFYINTIIGNPEILGDEMGWNMEEFLETLANNPDATSPLGESIYRRILLQDIIALSLGEYIDFTKGEAYFDRGDFKQLLEFAMTLPEFHSSGTHNIQRSIESGRQIMYIAERFDNFKDLKTLQLI